jgi:hypothetical protein
MFSSMGGGVCSLRGGKERGYAAAALKHARTPVSEERRRGGEMEAVSLWGEV